VVPVALTEDQRAAHDDLNLPIAKLLAMGKRRPLTPPEFLRLMSLLATQRVISNGMAQLNVNETWPDLRLRVPTPKLLESLATPKLTGQVGLRRRPQNLVDFHDEPQAAFLFLSDVGGVGLRDLIAIREASPGADVERPPERRRGQSNLEQPCRQSAGYPWRTAETNAPLRDSVEHAGTKIDFAHPKFTYAAKLPLSRPLQYLEIMAITWRSFT
jgi:hypothetical protein